MKRSRVVCLAVMAGTGIMFFILAAIFTPAMSLIERVKMKKMLPVAPGSYSYDYWATPPVPIHFGLHVFHITNPDEVRQGQPPALEEKGPYTYRVSLKKYNITFNANNTVTYRQRQTFVFDPDLSVGSDNDTFTTVNVPLFTVGTLMQYEYPALKEMINLLLEGLEEEAMISVSVHDIFWGYKDRFMTLAKDILDKLHLKSKLINGKFGFYMGRNDTDDGLYTVHTGTDDLSKFLIIDRWNGEKLLNYWSNTQANMINGTDGSLYPPFVTSDRVLQMYDSNLMRSMSMVYQGSSSVHGIPTMKFIVDDNQFANETVYPPNAGFCTPLHNCIPSGQINSSAMGYGAPLYASLPHFLGADPYYFRLVDGLHPSRELHQPYFNLHQLTGVCLKAARRYQLNAQIKEYDFLTKTHGLSLAYVPVLWIDGVAEIDDRIADLFKDQIEDVMAILGGVHIAFYCLAPVLLLIPIGVALVARWRRRRSLQRKPISQNGHGLPNGTGDGAVSANGTVNTNGALRVNCDNEGETVVADQDETTPLLLNS